MAAGPPSDIAKAAALARMKWVAAAMLAAAAVLFWVAHAAGDGAGGWGYAESFAEAAMVGALADWFAVTALFRHPLGLPIPHTAIIPTRKDQIGRSLGEFVETNFLTTEVLGERLRGAHVGRRLGEWLRHPDNAATASAGAADALRGAMEVLDDRHVSAGLERAIEARIRATPVAPLLARAVDIAVEGGHHQRMLDSVLKGLAAFLDENRGTLRERLHHESPWWVPEPVDDRIFAKILGGAERYLAEVRADPAHELRHSAELRLKALAEQLRTDPAMARRGEELKDELLAHPAVREWLTSVWGETKQSLVRAAADPASDLRQRLRTSVERVGARLAVEPELQATVDRWLERAVGHVVENYRSEVSDLIASTVARWDAQDTSRRMELQVGRDLQFIRINGTLVGGLVGLIIHTATQLTG